MTATATASEVRMSGGFCRERQGRLGFLINGIRLTGAISSSDRHVVLLDSSSGTLMVYKHVIAIVSEPYTAVRATQDPRSPISRDRRAPSREGEGCRTNWTAAPQFHRSHQRDARSLVRRIVAPRR